MKIALLTADAFAAVLGYLERQGAEDEDLPAVCSEFKSPPVQVIDDVD